jgi:5-hydroxyisourate hydrolase-like protein (transthyretin family)
MGCKLSIDQILSTHLLDSTSGEPTNPMLVSTDFHDEHVARSSSNVEGTSTFSQHLQNLQMMVEQKKI